MSTPEVAIRCSGISKSFGGTRALANVDLEVAAGGVHALVGENGAGKSTLLGVLSGRIVPTEGSAEAFGAPLPFGSPRACIGLGIAAVYQELKLVPALSAKANVFIGAEPSRRGLLDERRMERRFEELSSGFGHTIDPSARADTLSIAEQQLVEIMRALNANARVLLFDEPTAALPEAERQSVTTLVRELSRRGITVVFVSHNLDEVLAVSDTVTVLRNGEKVRSAPREAWSKRELVRAMLGRYVEFKPRRSRTRGREILRAEGVTVEGTIADVDITVHEGEIVGLAGLVGSGRTTLLRSLAGSTPITSGRMWIDGREVRWPRTARQGLALGIALLPEDRKADGLVLGMPARDNVTLMDLRAVSRLSVVSVARQRTTVARLATAVGFDPRLADRPAQQLSGGNQQKILLAKLLHRGARILLADEPTRGVDVGSKTEILSHLEELAGSGFAVVIASAELEDVLTISDRVIVMSEGRKAREMETGEQQLSVAEVLEIAFRVDEVIAE
jgi:ABC-type sugar transport system ATPase subunit